MGKLFIVYKICWQKANIFKETVPHLYEWSLYKKIRARSTFVNDEWRTTIGTSGWVVNLLDLCEQMNEERLFELINILSIYLGSKEEYDKIDYVNFQHILSKVYQSASDLFYRFLFFFLQDPQVFLFRYRFLTIYLRN